MEQPVLKLDKMGFAVSSGAACSSGLTEPSHVLKAIGLSHEKAQCSLRFTFGEENNIKDVKKLVEALACSSGLTEPSHVLKAIGLSHEKAQCSLRFTFGEENNIKDVKKLVEALKEIYFN